jgi:hypothetical protein
MTAARFSGQCPWGRRYPVRMRSFLVIGLVLAVATPPAALSQTICLPADAQTATLKLDISRYSSATAGDEKIVRDSLRLPYVPENQVTVVSQEATCRKANAALQSLFANTGNNTFSGRVYVLQVGTAYAVVDPAYRHDPSISGGPILFLDSRFNPLSTTF